MHLAKLPSARDAFGKKPLTWRTEDTPKRYARTIYPLKPQLSGFEIVVASSNNGAVENVTLEVPAAKAVDLKSFPDADYLSGPATILTGTPCWGAIAWCTASPPAVRSIFAQSTWLDVAARPTGSKWNPAEGQYAARTLRTILDRITLKMDDELEDPETDLPEWAASDKDR